MLMQAFKDVDFYSDDQNTSSQSIIPVPLEFRLDGQLYLHEKPFQEEEVFNLDFLSAAGRKVLRKFGHSNKDCWTDRLIKLKKIIE